MKLWDKIKDLVSEPVDEPTEEIKVEQINKEPKKIKPKKVEPKIEIEDEIEPTMEIEKTAPVKMPEVEEEKEIVEEKKEEVKPTRESRSPFFGEDEIAYFETNRPKKVEKKVDPREEMPRRREEVERPKEKETKLYGGSYTQGSYTSTSILTQEKPTFKPTPIISPIYGILDKNYSKDDIVEKTEKSSYTTSPTRRDKFDEVRNKAYGTLEDEIEDVVYYPESEPVKEEKDIFEELEKREMKTIELEDTTELAETVKEQEKNIKELEEITMDLTKELDNLLLKKESFNDKKEQIEKENSDAQLTENELFNLIDSMYEEGKE